MPEIDLNIHSLYIASRLVL